MACVRERRGGGDGDIAVDIVLQRFEMKGEKKKENLSSWHQTQREGDGNCRTKECMRIQAKWDSVVLVGVLRSRSPTVNRGKVVDSRQHPNVRDFSAVHGVLQVSAQNRDYISHPYYSL